MRRLLRLAAALLVAVASGDTAPPPEEPEPMASSNTLGGEFIVAAAAAPEPDAEEVDAAGEAAAAFEARRAALSEAMAPPDDYDAWPGEDDAADAAAEAAALEAQKARRKNDPAYEARRAQAWGELSPWERRRCDARSTACAEIGGPGHYAVLGLRRSAPAAAVKQKYRQKALLVHPDKNPSPDAQLAFGARARGAARRRATRPSGDYDRRMRRKAEVRRQRIVREVRAIVETAAGTSPTGARRAEATCSAMAVAFLLV
ncbi:dihydrokaempferol 4-reductase [Aureococcus anophagefferens]|uniref:Dihydrokaempferol 4-reductase n=1 Tax=Aureococcus anophagefferens TaxID=44056 RepID=A0ABR1G8T2_AURAN